MIIDGKLQSEKLRKKIKDELTDLCQSTKDVPKLSVILIGDYLPSLIYVKNKQKKAKEVGIKSEVIKYPETVSEKEVLDKIKSLNNDKEVTGILVQLPLPKQISQKKIINSIDPKTPDSQSVSEGDAVTSGFVGMFQVMFVAKSDVSQPLPSIILIVVMG